MEVRRAQAETFEQAVNAANQFDLINVKAYKRKEKTPEKDFKLKLNMLTDEQKKSSINGLSKAEKQRRMKEKLCLNCAEKDCRVQTCTKDFVKA